jgi:hypothetical protein
MVKIKQLSLSQTAWEDNGASNPSTRHTAHAADNFLGHKNALNGDLHKFSTNIIRVIKSTIIT